MLRLSHLGGAALISIATLGAMPGNAATNLITNGSFTDTHAYNAWPLFPVQPNDWTTANWDSEMTAGGDWYQNTAFVTESSDYGNYGVPSNPLLAVYNLGSATQSFGVANTGTFTLAWQDAAPLTEGNYGNYMVSQPKASGLSYEVLLDGAVIFHADTAIGQTFADHALTFNMSAGQHTLSFAGLDVGETIRGGYVNQYAFQSRVFVGLIDNVSISAVPEISSASAWMLGLVVLLGTSLARRRNAT